MQTVGGPWVLTVLVGTALMLLGLSFWLIARSSNAFTVLVRCPMTGNTTTVQHVADEGSFVTDLVTCGAFSRGQPITCGLPCLTGGVRTRVPSRSEDLVKV
jgi:hypothetical protein